MIPPPRPDETWGPEVFHRGELAETMKNLAELKHSRVFESDLSSSSGPGSLHCPSVSLPHAHHPRHHPTSSPSVITTV